jgi:hypothetical protein
VDAKGNNKMNSHPIKKIGAFVIACSILLTGCSINIPNNRINANTIIGSGNSVTENRAVSGINAVSLTNSGKLVVQYGTTESLSITADDNILPTLTSDVINGRLILGSKPNTSITTRNGIVYLLTVKNLQAIEITGSGDAIVSGVNGNDLKATVTGSGSLTVDGALKSQTVTITGSGDYNGTNLSSHQASVTCSGSGSVTVKVSESLKVHITGSGSVGYIGDPQITEKIVTGSGTLHKH